MQPLRRICTTLALAAAAITAETHAAEAPGPNGGKSVVLDTADGFRLAAEWWDEPTDGAAGAVLVHGVGTDRSAWTPLVRALRARRVEVLAIDLRGCGGSVVQHGVRLGSGRIEDDLTLLREMHADVAAAAAWLVRKGGCARDRVALVGADLGAAVALDVARRHPGDVAAVALLVPAPPRGGLDATELARAIPAATPVLVVTETIAAAPAHALAKARPASRVLVFPTSFQGVPTEANSVFDGTCAISGPRRMPIAPLSVASFVAAKTGSKTDDVVLDGIVETKGADADPWPRATRVAGAGGQAWAYRVGDRIEFGGIAPASRRYAVVEVDDGRTADVPIDMASTATIDLASGHVIDSRRFVRASGAPALAPLPRRQHVGGDFTAEWLDWPVVRVVGTPEKATFEGEWVLDEVPRPNDIVRFRVRFETTVPAEPNIELGPPVDRPVLASR